jgi:hypothetical protein
MTVLLDTRITQATRFFFGEDMCNSLMDDPFGVTLPECTSVWWINR